MTGNKSVWNKIFAIRESFYKQFGGEITQHNIQIQSEWYAFSHWIYTIYRKSFASRDERKSFEYDFSQCSTNAERVHCFMACESVQVKFSKYAKKLWHQSDVPARRGFQALKNWLIKNNLVPDISANVTNAGYVISTGKVDDPFADLERYNNLNQEIEEIHVKCAPTWEDYVENDSLRGVSSLVKLGNHPVKRRQLLASNDIPNGSIIARESALCFWLAPVMYESYCYNCLVPLPETRLTCRGCKMANFCSIDCFDSARNDFHGIECAYMGMLKHLSIFHFTLRLLIILGPSKVVAASISQFNSSSNWPSHSLDEQAQFDPSTFLNEGGDEISSFLNLEYGMQGVTKSDMLTFSCTALFTCHLLREMSIFDVKLPFKPLFSSLISMMILTSRNIFTLYDHTFRLLKVPETPDVFIEGPGKEVGHGLFYKTSLFNHSCRPNAHAVFFGSSIVVITTKPIGANEEITISYGAKHPEMKLEDRQAKLRDNFYFNCLCNQCEIDLIERARAKTCGQCLPSLKEKIISGQTYLNESGEIIVIEDVDDNNNAVRNQKCPDCSILVKEKQRLDKMRTIGLEYYAKGRKLIHKEDYDKAVRYLAKSLKYFTKVNDLWYIYLVREDLVACYSTLENHEKAYQFCLDNLKLRGQLYEVDTTIHANLLLTVIEYWKNADANFDLIEGSNVIESIVDSFDKLHSELSNQQGRFIEHTNQYYIDFLLNKKLYAGWFQSLIQESKQRQRQQQQVEIIE